VKHAALPTAAFSTFHVLPSRHTARRHWPAASLAVYACQPASLQCPSACAEPCGSPGACIGGASCALPIPAAHLLVWSRDDSRRPWRRSQTWPASGWQWQWQWQRMFRELPADPLAATLTVDRSLMGCSLLGHYSLPTAAGQALEHPSSPQTCRAYCTVTPRLDSAAATTRTLLSRPSHAPITASPQSSVLSPPRDPRQSQFGNLQFCVWPRGQRRARKGPR
jgi:hypothetical protein